MKITFDDDKKEKYQSHKCSTNICHFYPMFYFDADLGAFGSTKEEAQRNFELARNRLIISLGGKLL